jgi:hypothetical protein
MVGLTCEREFAQVSRPASGRRLGQNGLPDGASGPRRAGQDAKEKASARQTERQTERRTRRRQQNGGDKKADGNKNPGKK